MCDIKRIILKWFGYYKLCQNVYYKVHQVLQHLLKRVELLSTLLCLTQCDNYRNVRQFFIAAKHQIPIVKFFKFCFQIIISLRARDGFIQPIFYKRFDCFSF